jgi:ureidoglycolate lyase
MAGKSRGNERQIHKLKENNVRTIKAQALTHESFHFFGSFADFLPEKIPDINLDLLTLDMGRPYEMASFSLIRAQPAPQNIAVMSEYHSWTGQIFLPLDGDVLLYVARPTTGECPVEKMQAFYVPQGTMISIKPGVWHFSPLAVKNPVNVMLALPQRTWANDVTFYSFTEEEKFAIEI